MGRREAVAGVTVQVFLAFDRHQTMLKIALIDPGIRQDLALIEHRLVDRFTGVGEGHCGG